MDMGTSYPVNLPLSDPGCNSELCYAFAAAENASQEAVPWAGQFEYGHWTTWYWVIILFILTVAHGIRLWRSHSSNTRAEMPRGPGIGAKVVAIGRYLHYRQFQGQWAHTVGTPPFGILAFLLITALFLAILTFAAHPYYRVHTGYGSPPLAIRTGLMAFACTPILVALAGKANLVTLLTGVSHEKLNVFHRWVALFVLFLSLVHTIPFLIAPIRDVGYTTLHTYFYSLGPIAGTMYSGVPPLAFLVALVVFSIPPIRRRMYTIFSHIHFLFAIIYIGLLFWHAGNFLDSWAYLWATIAVWLCSVLVRTFWKTQPLNIQSQWLVGAPTTMRSLPGGMTRIQVLAPPGFRHSCGQHLYLRIPAVSWIENHPFTIASAPLPDTSGTEAEAPQQRLTILARTHASFTRRLAEACASDPDLLASSWIDGPYGGVSWPLEASYDDLILVAGGGGITACLPWLLHILNCWAGGNQHYDHATVRVQRVLLVWVVRRQEHLGWIEKELRQSTGRLGPSNGLAVELHFFVTGHGKVDESWSTKTGTNATPPKSLQDVDEKDQISTDGTAPPSSEVPTPVPDDVANLGRVEYGRPNLKTVVDGVVKSGKTFIIGCGPVSMRTDLANACAAAQGRVLRGQLEGLGLHLEAFDY